MNPYFYSDTISNFLASPANVIFGTITCNSEFRGEVTHKGPWTEEIRILKEVPEDQESKFFFEYSSGKPEFTSCFSLSIQKFS